MGPPAGNRLEGFCPAVGRFPRRPTARKPDPRGRISARLICNGARACGRIMVSDQGENVTYRQLIVDLTNDRRLPTIFPYREHFELGGFIAYGAPLTDAYRRLAGITDQILRGEKAGEIPIYLAS